MRTVERSDPGSARRGLSVGPGVASSMLAGIALGVLAVLVDEAPTPRIFVTLFSTGLSWGAAAVIAGAISRTRLIAAICGAAILGSAPVTYYGVNAWFSLRASSSDALLIAAVSWAVAGLLAGPVLGALGWNVRFGDPRASAIALGILSGLLMGQGVRWAMRYGLSLDPVFTPALVGPLLLFSIGLRDGPVIPGVMGLVAGAAAGGAAWAVLESIR